MDKIEQHVECQSPKCKRLGEFYVYGKKKYICANCLKLERPNRKVSANLFKPHTI